MSKVFVPALFASSMIRRPINQTLTVKSFKIPNLKPQKVYSTLPNRLQGFLYLFTDNRLRLRLLFP